MLRLITNDIKLNAAWLWLVFMLMNLGLILSGTFNIFPHRYSGLKVGFGYAMAMPLIVFLREAYYKGQLVNRSLPLSSLHLVLARYCSVILLGGVVVAYGWLYQAFLESMVPRLSQTYLAQQMEAGYAIEHSVIARGLGLSIILAIVAPLIVRFGTFWRIVIVYFAVQVIWGKLIDYLLAFSLHSTFFLGMSRWVFFASLLTITSLAISVRLSIWLHGQREF